MPQLLNQWASNSPDSSEKPGLGRVFLCLKKVFGVERLYLVANLPDVY